MYWTQLKVTCRIEDLNSVTAVMSMLDNRLMIEDYSDIETGLNTIYGELIDEAILNADKTHAKVSMYIDERNNYNDYILFIKERFRALGLEDRTDIELIGVDDEDWENNWKRFYKPLKIGERLMIVPMWEDYDAKDGEVVVKMDPGLAFGSGTHETTKLCAALIEKYMEPGMRVLDVGTGSGILAICESKLGAKEIFAYDIDPIAVRVAKENAEKNDVHNVTCGVSDLLRDVDTAGGPYDFVSANIVADIIIRMTPDLERVTKFGSLICVSGVIEEYAKDVIECMESHGFGIADIIDDKDWKGILFKRIF
ncbi:MAG: 50S ribosomal protein L11 methyltransferase [Ruminococcaceae bacterium]|nr:50S ribosomal protein L11 methyltransferase [Oscillospiraceae bacterium]